MADLSDPGEYRERIASRTRYFIKVRGWGFGRDSIEAATDMAVQAVPNPASHPRPSFTSAEVQSARPTPPPRCLNVRRRGR